MDYMGLVHLPTTLQAVGITYKGFISKTIALIQKRLAKTFGELRFVWQD